MSWSCNVLMRLFFMLKLRLSEGIKFSLPEFVEKIKESNIVTDLNENLLLEPSGYLTWLDKTVDPDAAASREHAKKTAKEAAKQQ